MELKFQHCHLFGSSSAADYSITLHLRPFLYYWKDEIVICNLIQKLVGQQNILTSLNLFPLFLQQYILLLNTAMFQQLIPPKIREALWSERTKTANVSYFFL